MILNDLIDDLSGLPDEAALVFESSGGPIAGGYHVTELKHATVTSIDCGTRVAEWTEAALQLLDGNGGEFMTVGTFRTILARSVGSVAGLGDAPLHVEFAPGNAGMRIWQLSAPELRDSRVTIELSEDRAHCKPALETRALGSAAPNCCSTGPAAGSCCG